MYASVECQSRVETITVASISSVGLTDMHTYMTIKNRLIQFQLLPKRPSFTVDCAPLQERRDLMRTSFLQSQYLNRGTYTYLRPRSMFSSVSTERNTCLEQLSV